MNTVTEIVNALDRAGIVGELVGGVADTKNSGLDLIIRHEDVSLVRSVLIGVAKRQRRDALTECNHRTRVFRFYRVHPLEILRVGLCVPKPATIVTRFLRGQTEPCGAVLRVKASGQTARDSVYSALDSLVHANAIDAWGALPANEDGLSSKQRHALEQGVLLLRFCGGSGFDIAVEEDTDAREVTIAALFFLIRRHAVLLCSAECMPQGVACAY